MIEDIKDIWIYDIEVFCKDWLVVFKDVLTGEMQVAHNDKEMVLSFLRVRKPILCGFNSKHYDDYVLMTIITNGEPTVVKECNDWIIEGNQGFEFPGIQGEFKDNYFKSFDLRDDLPMDLSLKAIEGNMNSDIRESKIDFTIDHKLEPAELAEVIEYCKTDVENTLKLFHARRAYLDGKLKVAKVGDIEPVKALSMTNPKLAAHFLGAKKLDDPNKGELVYEPPKCLKLTKYKEALDFYLAGVDYQKKLEIKAKDLTLVYGWGGIHGAIEHASFESTKDFKIVDIDVGSYYPSQILQLGYYPEAIPSAKGYEEVYNTRIKAKHAGDSDTADALKLVLNSTYGALKNQYNPLYQPKIANHICISGQLLLTDLIEKLEAVPTVKIIQANTDGIMLGYHPKQEKVINSIVADWEQRTKLNMEYTEIKKIAQKDVNNYVMVAGRTYLIKDGKEQVTKEDKNKVAVKGGYVSLYFGGDFKNNSLVVVHRAVADYFLYGTPPEETIEKATDIHDFQMICKTGHTYDGCIYKWPDGDITEMQRANRVYAIADEQSGTLYKVKGERHDKIASIPEHCVVDNAGNVVRLSAIDKAWYVQLAEKRIMDFLGKKPVINKTKETKNMATTKKEDKNIYMRLAQARLDFLQAGVQKHGKNPHLGFKYYELDDIVPTATKVMTDNGLIALVDFGTAQGTMEVINMENPEETIVFNSPIAEIESNKGTNKMQCIGSGQTYVRRYLWNMVLDITEPDTFDFAQKEEKPAPKAPATKEERKEIAQQVATEKSDDQMTELQKESIKKGFAKLKEKGGHTKVLKQIKAEVENGITSGRAEELLSEIGALLYGE